LKSTSTQRQHLAATHPCVSTQEDHEVRARIERVRGVDEALVLVEVVELGQRRPRLEHGNGARNAIDDLPTCRCLERVPEDTEHVVDGFSMATREMRFQELHVFVVDGVEPLVSELRVQVVLVRLLDPVDRACLEAIGLRMVADVAAAEFAKRRHLLLSVLLLLQEDGRWPHQELALPCLAPTLRGRLGFDPAP
jgi:hypothetical protein